MKRFSRSEVKGQGHIVQMCECYNSGGIHFDGVAWRLTGSIVFSVTFSNRFKGLSCTENIFAASSFNLDLQFSAKIIVLYLSILTQC